MSRPPLLYILILPKLKLLQMFHLFCIFSNAPKYGRQVHHQAVLRVLLTTTSYQDINLVTRLGSLTQQGKKGLEVSIQDLLLKHQVNSLWSA